MPGMMLSQGMLKKHRVLAGHRLHRARGFCQRHRPTQRNTSASLQWQGATAETSRSSAGLGSSKVCSWSPALCRGHRKELGRAGPPARAAGQMAGPRWAGQTWTESWLPRHISLMRHILRPWHRSPAGPGYGHITLLMMSQEASMSLQVPRRLQRAAK